MLDGLYFLLKEMWNVFFLFGFSYENFIWDSFLSSDCHSGQTEMEKTCKGVKKKDHFSWAIGSDVIDSHDMQ